MCTRKGCWTPGTKIADGCELPCGWWEGTQVFRKRCLSGALLWFLRQAVLYVGSCRVSPLSADPMSSARIFKIALQILPQNLSQTLAVKTKACCILYKFTADPEIQGRRRNAALEF